MEMEELEEESSWEKVTLEGIWERRREEGEQRQERVRKCKRNRKCGCRGFILLLRLLGFGGLLHKK